MGPCPAIYDTSKLTLLNINQVVHWDETHLKQCVGVASIGSRALRQYQFKRDDLGRVDLEHGAYQAVSVHHKMNLKYPKEARMSLGCCTVELPCGQIVGRRCEPFFYSEKWLLNVDEWDKAVAEEVARVKALPSESSEWITGQRDMTTSGLYLLDDVRVLAGVGKSVASKLNSVGIYTLSDLVGKTDNELTSIATSLGGLTKRHLDSLRGLALGAKHGAYIDVVVDHRKADNPYLSRYGSDWEMVVAASTALSRFASVKHLVHHIVRASASVMVGTKYADSWYWYHDALPQLTAKCTIAWLDSVGLLDRWIRPELGLNKGTAFAGRPVGNSPELMAWDSSLNKDVKDQLRRHTVFTCGLDKHDPRRFSMATPRQIEDGIRRLLAPSDDPDVGVPSGRRIIQDVQRCMGPNLLAIIGAQGAVVEGLGDRNGRRRLVTGQRGGKRERAASAAPQWLHPDAKAGVQQIIARAEMRNAPRAKRRCDIIVGSQRLE